MRLIRFAFISLFRPGRVREVEESEGIKKIDECIKVEVEVIERLREELRLCDSMLYGDYNKVPQEEYLRAGLLAEEVRNREKVLEQLKRKRLKLLIEKV